MRDVRVPPTEPRPPSAKASAVVSRDPKIAGADAGENRDEHRERGGEREDVSVHVRREYRPR